MIREDLYYTLLSYATKFCKTHTSVNPVDLTHDVIVEGGISEKNFTKLFYKKLRDYKEYSVVSFNEAFTSTVRNIEEEFCYDCGYTMPKDMFYQKGDKYCKCHKNKRDYLKDKHAGRKDSRTAEQHANRAKANRENLTDGYIIERLRRSKHLSMGEITSEMVENKRKELLLKRRKKVGKGV